MVRDGSSNPANVQRPVSSVLLGGVDSVRNLLDRIKEEFRAGAVAALVGQPSTAARRTVDAGGACVLQGQAGSRRTFWFPSRSIPGWRSLLLSRQTGSIQHLHQQWTLRAITLRKAVAIAKEEETAKQLPCRKSWRKCTRKFAPR